MEIKDRIRLGQAINLAWDKRDSISDEGLFREYVYDIYDEIETIQKCFDERNKEIPMDEVDLTEKTELNNEVQTGGGFKDE